MALVLNSEIIRVEGGEKRTQGGMCCDAQCVREHKY